MTSLFCTMHTCTRKLHAVFLNSRLKLFLPQKRMNTRAAFTASHSRSLPTVFQFLCLRGLFILLSAQRSGNFSSIFLWNCVVLTSVSLIRFKKDSKIMLLMLFSFFFDKYLLMLIVLFSSNTLKVSTS